MEGKTPSEYLLLQIVDNEKRAELVKKIIPNQQWLSSTSIFEAAANLFSFLRKIDHQSKYRGIVVISTGDVGLGLAINDRLRRASHKFI